MVFITNPDSDAVAFARIGDENRSRYEHVSDFANTANVLYQNILQGDKSNADNSRS